MFKVSASLEYTHACSRLRELWTALVTGFCKYDYNSNFEQCYEMI